MTQRRYRIELEVTLNTRNAEDDNDVAALAMLKSDIEESAYAISKQMNVTMRIGEWTNRRRESR